MYALKVKDTKQSSLQLLLNSDMISFVWTITLLYIMQLTTIENAEELTISAKVFVIP